MTPQALYIALHCSTLQDAAGASHYKTPQAL